MTSFAILIKHASIGLKHKGRKISTKWLYFLIALLIQLMTEPHIAPYSEYCDEVRPYKLKIETSIVFDNPAQRSFALNESKTYHSKQKVSDVLSKRNSWSGNHELELILKRLLSRFIFENWHHLYFRYRIFYCLKSLKVLEKKHKCSSFNSPNAILPTSRYSNNFHACFPISNCFLWNLTGNFWGVVFATFPRSFHRSSPLHSTLPASAQQTPTPNVLSEKCRRFFWV